MGPHPPKMGNRSHWARAACVRALASPLTPFACVAPPQARHRELLLHRSGLHPHGHGLGGQGGQGSGCGSGLPLCLSPGCPSLLQVGPDICFTVLLAWLVAFDGQIITVRLLEFV